MNRSTDATGRWLPQRIDAWRAANANTERLEKRSAVSTKTLFAAVRAYPALARDVAIARRDAPKAKVTRQLEQTFSRLHRVITQPRSSPRAQLGQLLDEDLPRITHRLRYHILTITLLFFGFGLAGWWIVRTYPELAVLFASEAMINGVQRGELWTDDLLNILPSSLLSIQIFTNNIAVTLAATTLGCAYGLGTLYIIGLNGLMLGGIFALTHGYALDGRLAAFVCAHGFVELSVIFVAGAVGVSLGEAIARPGAQKRSKAFQRAASEAIPLIGTCVFFLIGAGLIEGYISPNPSVPVAARCAIGLTYWIIFVQTLRGRLRLGRLFASPGARAAERTATPAASA